MKIAVIGSRCLTMADLSSYIPACVSEIVSGGAKGIDSSAASYAAQHNLKLTVFLPDYPHFGKAAPLLRNRQIVEYSDMVVAFWDGRSRGTKHVIDYCKMCGKPIAVHLIPPEM